MSTTRIRKPDPLAKSAAAQVFSSEFRLVWLHEGWLLRLQGEFRCDLEFPAGPQKHVGVRHFSHIPASSGLLALVHR